MNSIELIENNSLTNIEVTEGQTFVFTEIALTAINMAREEGTERQAKQSPWINVNERMPEENENIIIMCEHGAIFNGTYSKGTWFCMDGYLYDTYKGNPLYSSMTGIPPLWEPIAWMPIPKFNE